MLDTLAKIGVIAMILVTLTLGELAVFLGVGFLSTPFLITSATVLLIACSLALKLKIWEGP